MTTKREGISLTENGKGIGEKKRMKKKILTEKGGSNLEQMAGGRLDPMGSGGRP